MTQDLTFGGRYQAEQVLTALLTSGRTMRFRYEWLGVDNELKGDLTRVVSDCTITHNYLADIKRTARFTFVEHDSLLDGFLWQTDRIRPWAGVLMPDGVYAEWPQGVFLLSSPTRSYDSGLISRDIQAYDQTQVLKDNTFTSRHVLAKDTIVTQAIVDSLVAIPQMNVSDVSEETLTAAKSYDPGSDYALVVNDLAKYINYGSLWFDGYGAAQVQPYTEPADALATLTYSTEDRSMFTPQVDQTLDLFSVPNRIVYVVSRPEKPSLVSSFVNSDPRSVVSTVSRGRTVTKFDATQDAASQAVLDGLVKKAAINAANVYETVEFTTPCMPVHEDRDTLQLVHTGLGLSGLYSETQWEMDLRVGGQMKHSVRRVVNIDSSLIGDPTEDTT